MANDERHLFPNPCNRCGFCCLIQLCKVAQHLFGGEKNRRCPAVRFNGTESRCGVLEDLPQHAEVIERMIGVGEGCGIISKVRGADGEFYDFAALPDQVKIELTERKLKNEIEVRYKKNS